MAAASAAWAVYVAHSLSTGKGLYGWVTEQGLQHTDSASTTTVLLISLAIGVLPITAVFAVLARALGVSLQRPRGALPSGTPAQIRLRAVAGCAAIFVAAAAVILALRPHGVPPAPAPFDLDAATAATPGPPDAPLVGVLGTPQRDLTAGYRETRSGSGESTSVRFMPLTAHGWTRETPVQFFVAGVQRSDETAARGMIASPSPGGRTRSTASSAVTPCRPSRAARSSNGASGSRTPTG